MSKRWTAEEDAILLEWHSAVDADFVASHDLGRPHGAGSRRLHFLTISGAREAYARMKIADAQFHNLAGRSSEHNDDNLERWQREEEAAVSDRADALGQPQRGSAP